MRSGRPSTYATIQEPQTHNFGSSPGFRVMAPEEAADYARMWLRIDDPAVTSRLVPFASLGDEGTQAAFWLDESGRQRIVIMGSGWGSNAACVLTDDLVDFLRLLAIGYLEVCWHDEWTSPPQPWPEWPNKDWTPINEPYRRWVSTTFGVTIPDTGSQLVPRPAVMGEEGTDDDFANWLNRVGQIEDGAQESPG